VIPAEQLWLEMQNADDQNFIMACWTTKDPAQAAGRGASGEVIASDGIVKGHAYSLIAVDEYNCDGQIWRVVRCRNPWGNNPAAEWNGELSDNWPEWPRYPQLKEALQISTAQLDGMFWMPWDKFRERFSDFGIAPQAGSTTRLGKVELACEVLPQGGKHMKQFRKPGRETAPAPAIPDAGPEYGYADPNVIRYAAPAGATYAAPTVTTYAAAPATYSSPVTYAAPTVTTYAGAPPTTYAGAPTTTTYAGAPATYSAPTTYAAAPATYASAPTTTYASSVQQGSYTPATTTYAGAPATYSAPTAFTSSYAAPTSTYASAPMSFPSAAQQGSYTPATTTYAGAPATYSAPTAYMGVPTAPTQASYPATTPGPFAATPSYGAPFQQPYGAPAQRMV